MTCNRRAMRRALPLVGHKCHDADSAAFFSVFEEHFQIIRTCFLAHIIKKRILCSCCGIDIKAAGATRIVRQLNNRMSGLGLVVADIKAVMSSLAQHDGEFSLRHVFALHGFGEPDAEMFYIFYSCSVRRAFVDERLVALGITAANAQQQHKAYNVKLPHNNLVTSFSAVPLRLPKHPNRVSPQVYRIQN